MKSCKNLKIASILLLTLAWHLFTNGQIDQQKDLYKTILQRDSLLFNVGFNTCDLTQFENLLSENFEFTHDQNGISNRSEFLRDLKNGLCQSPETYQSRRELITESTEIFPLYEDGVLYGAIQKGNHRFYETKTPSPEQYASSARFTHVWILENGVWKLYSALSYDHRQAGEVISTHSLFDQDTTIASWLNENHIHTLGIGVIQDGRLHEVAAYGDLMNGRPAPYNTVFNVASLTKPITAIVTLKLVSSGKWKLDEPIFKYWVDPDLASDPNLKKLTTRHILSHQTGFTNWRGNNPDGKLHFEFEPGTRYQYSGEGYEYLRKALEHKFKKTFDQLATELVFQPLSMTDTKYVWDNQTDSTRYAMGYSTEGVPYPVVKRDTPNAADDLLTTVEDYGNFLVSVMHQQGLSNAVFQEMITHQVQTKKNKYFGLGFEIYDFENGEYALSHGGSDEGCQTIVFMIPATKQGLLIFTNADEGYRVYEKILLHYLGDYGKKIIDIEMQ